MSKTKMSITNEKFLELAKNLKLNVGGVDKLATPRKFESGSVGYNANGEVILTVGDEPVAFQLSMNLIAKGSKPVSEKKPAAK